MKGWTKDGERVDLSPEQEEEVRAYIKWANSVKPGSRFMFSYSACADKNQVFITTLGRMRDYYRKTGNWFPGEKTMRRFLVYRPSPPESYREGGYANAPDEIQFEGVIFSDGTCCVRWLTECRSHSVWASFEDLLKVHGHPEYGSEIEWLDPQQLRIKLSDLKETGSE